MQILAGNCSIGLYLFLLFLIIHESYQNAQTHPQIGQQQTPIAEQDEEKFYSLEDSSENAKRDKSPLKRQQSQSPKSGTALNTVTPTKNGSPKKGVRFEDPKGSMADGNHLKDSVHSPKADGSAAGSRSPSPSRRSGQQMGGMALLEKLKKEQKEDPEHSPLHSPSRPVLHQTGSLGSGSPPLKGQLSDNIIQNLRLTAQDYRDKFEKQKEREEERKKKEEEKSIQYMKLMAAKKEREQKEEDEKERKQRQSQAAIDWCKAIRRTLHPEHLEVPNKQQLGPLCDNKVCHVLCVDLGSMFQHVYELQAKKDVLSWVARFRLRPMDPPKADSGHLQRKLAVGLTNTVGKHFSLDDHSVFPHNGFGVTNHVDVSNVWGMAVDDDAAGSWIWRELCRQTLSPIHEKNAKNSISCDELLEVKDGGKIAGALRLEFFQRKMSNLHESDAFNHRVAIVDIGGIDVWRRTYTYDGPKVTINTQHGDKTSGHGDHHDHHNNHKLAIAVANENHSPQAEKQKLKVVFISRLTNSKMTSGLNKLRLTMASTFSHQDSDDE